MARINKTSDVEIRTAKGKDKRYYINDGGGLRLEITPNNSKIWNFRYTYQGKRRETTFKSYPTVSLTTARKMRDNFNELIAQGVDPIEHGKEIKKSLEIVKDGEIEAVIAKWLKDQEWADSTRSRISSLMQRTVIARFKGKAIASIKHGELSKMLQDVAVQNGAETAHRLFSHLNNIWRYACSYGLCEFNITTNIYKKTMAQANLSSSKGATTYDFTYEKQVYLSFKDFRG